MKKLALAFCIVFAGCATSKPSIDSYESELLRGRESKHENIIISRSGERSYPAAITYPNHGSLSTDKYFLHADGNKIFYGDMLAWQDKNSFKINAHLKGSKDGTILNRLRGGKLNLYMNPVSGTGNTLYFEYYFDKADVNADHARYDNFRAAVADNAAALALFEQLFPKKHFGDDRQGMMPYAESVRERLTKVTELYNQ